MSIYQDDNELCGCGSGKLHGNCHGPILSAPKEQMLFVAHEEYANSWRENADFYEQQGVYDILALELVQATEVKLMLDIGCGLGHGLVAVRRQSKEGDLMIVAIDDNRMCLELAAAKLSIQPTPQNITRAVDQISPDGMYHTSFPTEIVSDLASTKLIQSNILVEDEIREDFFDSLGKLDAVTQWCCGSHKARTQMTLTAHFSIKSDADYREAVEEFTVELAANRLRTGGILQIATRFAANSLEEGVELVALEYGDLLAERGFSIKSIKAFPYSEAQTEYSISVVSLDPANNILQKYITSLIAIKH